MSNVGGPRQRSRWLIANVVRSIILYAAPVWAPAMTVKAYGKSCKAAYRTCALRVLSAFRTVSDDAALVLAGMIPLDLLAEEARCSGDPTTKRDATMAKWQERWRATANGSWTKPIVPDIRPWTRLLQPTQHSAQLGTHLHTGRHDSISETSSGSVHAGNLAHLYVPCASSAQLGSLVPIQEHPAGQRMRSLSSPPLLLRDCLNSRTPSCSAQVSLVSAAEQLNFPDAAQMHHYGRRCTVRSSEEIAVPAK
ncbi:hypothetical protein ACLKA6_001146 [Drosophila palustris]